MARATYLYIVVDKDDQLVAGFTVKHELITWLGKHIETGYRIWRVPDGGRRPPIEMTLELEVTDAAL